MCIENALNESSNNDKASIKDLLLNSYRLNLSNRHSAVGEDATVTKNNPSHDMSLTRGKVRKEVLTHTKNRLK